MKDFTKNMGEIQHGGFLDFECSLFFRKIYFMQKDLSYRLKNVLITSCSEGGGVLELSHALWQLMRVYKYSALRMDRKNKTNFERPFDIELDMLKIYSNQSL